MSPLILHIGWSKCGSTSIQNSIYEYGRANARVSIPNEAFIDKCLPQSISPFDVLEPNLFTHCVEYVDGHLRMDFDNGVSFISSEHLAYAAPSTNVSQDTHVFCVSRHPTSWLPSQWAHKVVHSPMSEHVSDFSSWVKTEGFEEYSTLIKRTVAWSECSNFSIFGLGRISEAVASIKNSIGLRSILKPKTSINRHNVGVGVKIAKLLHSLRKIAQSEYELSSAEWSELSFFLSHNRAFEKIAEAVVDVSQVKSPACSHLSLEFNSNLGGNKLTFQIYQMLEVPSVRDEELICDIANALLATFFRRHPCLSTFNERTYGLLRPDVLKDFLKQNPAGDKSDYRVFLRRHFSQFGAQELIAFNQLGETP